MKCKQALKQGTECGNYDSCYNGKVAAYEAAKSTTQTEEAGYKIQWRALKRMKCILGTFGNGTATDAGTMVKKRLDTLTIHKSHSSGGMNIIIFEYVASKNRGDLAPRDINWEGFCFERGAFHMH